MRFGPLALKSTIGLSNIGIDSNVFNANDAENPQSDFTMAFTPTTDVWLRMGRTWITGRIDVDWVYYRRFASERSANSDYLVGVTRTFNRLSLSGNARRLNTRERPGFEIDARSQRLETELDGNVEMRVLGKTFVGARAWRRRIAFDRLAVFREASLAEELNRTATGRSMVLRHVMTPLTTVVLEIGRDQDRFIFSPFRDTDSTRISGTARFQPLALISGSATVGYRRLTPLSPTLRPFNGMTANVGLSYSLLGMTRVGVDVTRDVQPSFELDLPHYLETGFSVSVQQQVFGPFDVLGQVRRRRLAYRTRIGAAADAAGADRVRGLSLGAGYRLGTDKRIGFAIDHDTRASGRGEREYAATRFGMSLTYER